MTAATKFIGVAALVLPLLTKAGGILVRDDINTLAAHAMQCWAELVVLRSADTYCDEFMRMEEQDIVPMDEDVITRELGSLDGTDRERMEAALNNYGYALGLVTEAQKSIMCELDPFGVVFSY